MKTIGRFAIGFVVLLLATYATLTTIKLHQLETRLAKLESAQSGHLFLSPVTYAFDEAFVEYFGPDGMTELENRLNDRRSAP